MTKNEKDYDAANNSSRTVTPDCESVNPSNLVSQLNLLPRQMETEQTITDSNNCTAIGNDANGSTVSPQTNHVQENYGVTGITGTGHTINIYQYPKELINLIKTLYP
jgi:hypothetical protein